MTSINNVMSISGISYIGLGSILPLFQAACYSNRKTLGILSAAQISINSFKKSIEMKNKYVPITSKIPKIVEIDLSEIYPKTMKFEMLRLSISIYEKVKMISSELATSSCRNSFFSYNPISTSIWKESVNLSFTKIEIIITASRSHFG